MILTRLLIVLALFSFATPLLAQEGLGEPGCQYVQNQDGEWECVLSEEDQDVVVVTGRNNPTFADLVHKEIIPFIDGYVIQFLYVLAFLFFVYGVAKFFLIGQSSEDRQKGKQFVVFGLLGLVVLFSVWSLVRIVATAAFPGGLQGEDPRAGLLPSGSRCENASQCRSGVCTIRGLYTSTCE